MEEKHRSTKRSHIRGGRGEIQPPNNQVCGPYIFFYRLPTLSPAICMSHPITHSPQIYTMDFLAFGDTVLWHSDWQGNKY